MIKYSYILFLGIFTAFQVEAQDLRADIQEMHKSYDEASSLAMKMQVTMYYTNQKEPQVMEAELYKQHNLYASWVDDITTIINARCALMVNHQTKTMVLGTEVPSLKMQGNMGMEDIDKIVSKYDAVNYKGIVEGSKRYEVETPKDVIQRTILDLDADDYHINKMVYYYNTTYSEIEKVEIDYLFFERNKPIKDIHFDEGQYVEKKNNEWVKHTKYAAYDLMITND